MCLKCLRTHGWPSGPCFYLIRILHPTESHLFLLPELTVDSEFYFLIPSCLSPPSLLPSLPPSFPLSLPPSLALSLLPSLSPPPSLPPAITIPEAWKSWNAPPIARTRNSIQQQRGRLRGKAEFSVKNHPVAKLPVNWNAPISHSVPVDILHLRSRIGEKKLKNLAAAAAVHEDNKFAPRFQELIRSAGIPFKISETLVHGKNQIVFSSLTGRRWRQLLPKLPQLIRDSHDVFNPDHKEPLAQIMEQFQECLRIAGTCQKEDADLLATKTDAWLKSFLQLGNKGLKGFASKDITPYCHWLHVHVPYTISLFGGLNKLSGELLEKQNDQIKLTHQRRTHCKDPKMTLQMEKRRELQQMIHEKEQMNKQPRVRRQGPLHPWYGCMNSHIFP